MDNHLQSRHKITGLMAVDPNGVIGLNDELPWNYPKDTAFFRETIRHQCIIMGHRTYLKMPEHILENCYSIVFSRSADEKPKLYSSKLCFVANIDVFLKLSLPQKSYMIGGGELVRVFLEHNLIDDFFLTEILKPYHGTVFFPKELIHGWPKKILRQTQDFNLAYYINPKREFLDENYIGFESVS